MESSVKITLIIVSGIIILGLLGFYLISMALPATNTITSTGEARVKSMPDLVGVYFNVENTADTAQEARDKNAVIVNNLIESLTIKGFEKNQIQTMNFNVYPEYNWENTDREITGYRAIHYLRIEMGVEENSLIGVVVDVGIDAGALVSYINFELSQKLQNKYKAESLELATKDAKIKAESIASGLGKSLGSIKSVSSSDFGYYPWRVLEAGSLSAEQVKSQATSIQPSEQEIYSSVTVVYKIA